MDAGFTILLRGRKVSLKVVRQSISFRSPSGMLKNREIFARLTALVQSDSRDNRLDCAGRVECALQSWQE